MLVRLSVRLPFQSLEPKLWGIRRSDRETISPNICQGWIRILRIFLSDPQFWESCPPLSQDSNWRPPEPLSAWSLENKLNAAGTLCSSSWHFHDSLKIGYWYSSHRTFIWKFLPDQVKVVSEYDSEKLRKCLNYCAHSSVSCYTTIIPTNQVSFSRMINGILI